MNILVIDQEVTGLDFVLRCADAGHNVRWYRCTTWPIRDGEGFGGFRVVDDWRPHMEWAREGLVFLTGNHRFLGELDRWRAHGWPIFGPTVASARLEIDRKAGMDAMEAAGIAIPAYQTFGSLAEAAIAARKSDDPLVFKTMGDEDDKSLSYVASDPADMAGWIKQKIRRGMRLKGPCMLQERIDMVAEVGVSGWMGPEGFLPDRWQICFEHKKLMNDDIGPNTGEQGTVCQYETSERLAADILIPMEPILRALGHRGDFAVGAGIDRKGQAWPFEFTARAGWPAFFIQCASHRGDPARWMADLLAGKDTLRVETDAAIGVVLAQPMYPYNKSPPELVEGNPIRVDPASARAVHPVSVMIDRGNLLTAGEYVLVATALGGTVSKARERVYRAIDGIRFPNRMYRTDIGCGVIAALPELHRLGYAKEVAA